MTAPITLSSFLAAFFPDENEEIHFRAFKPKGTQTKSDNAPVLITGTRRELAEDQSFQQRLKKLNENRGLYFAPNAGGAKDTQIVRFSAVFCEKDDLPIAEQHRLFDTAPVSPSIRVESRRSVHAYWLLKDTCTYSDQWVSLQQGLIDYFRSDPKIHNPSRVMRLPYFDHLSEDTSGSVVRQRVHLAHFYPEQRYTIDQIQKVFPPNREPGSKSGLPTETFLSWSDLSTELRRRVLSHPTCNIDRDGKWAHCKGVCHNGKGNTALALNIASGSYFCQAGCSTEAILRAFELPETPNSSLCLPQKPTDRNLWSPL